MSWSWVYMHVRIDFLPEYVNNNNKYYMGKKKEKGRKGGKAKVTGSFVGMFKTRLFPCCFCICLNSSYLVP